MSTDGPKPPSIAPKKPAGPSGRPSTKPKEASTGKTDAPRARPASAPVAGAKAPSTGATSGAGGPAAGKAAGPKAPAEPTGEQSTGSTTSTGPSVGDRVKNAARSAAESARSALPSSESTARTATSATTARTVRTTTVEEEPQAAGGPRRVRLAVSRIDPWSVMKLSFLLSFAIGIMIVVASAVVWFTLDELAIFSQVNDTIAEVTGSPDFFNLLEYVAFDRVIALAMLIAVVDIVLLTALSTIGAFLYNIVAALVGGIHLTLTDD
ncbi:DUF3566 domain-containing protein [Actinotalea sp. BY-33]|uniref:DUF3566 domain-containing protein n=1 Tax=Actinotalea soli TaxID=2819234 RepID=A0A939LMW8_9CELL|nr:DUF3566 domain-containing protein [Actinotalea soli]MBO1751182.1 DUF3566 domain-containing protein [Actinotalea soli]